MSIASLSKYIISFLFAVLVVLSVLLAITQAENKTLQKTNAVLKEQLVLRDATINEIDKNILISDSGIVVFSDNNFNLTSDCDFEIYSNNNTTINSKGHLSLKSNTSDIQFDGQVDIISEDSILIHCSKSFSINVNNDMQAQVSSDGFSFKVNEVELSITSDGVKIKGGNLKIEK